MSENPLKQFFRRPAIYMQLPSGGNGYPAHALMSTPTGEHPVYPMTAIDTITTKTPDALMNGQAVCDIIQSCVPSIKDGWEVKSVDLDALLIAIQIATNGAELDINTVCPKCEETSTFGVQLQPLMSTIKSGYDKPLVVGALNIVFAPLTYREVMVTNSQQFEVQRQLKLLNSLEDEQLKTSKTAEIVQLIGEITFQVITKMISKIVMTNAVVADKSHIIEYLKNVDKSTFEMIRDYSVKLREDAQIKPLDIKCSHCEHEYKQPLNLNVSDFFG